MNHLNSSIYVIGWVAVGVGVDEDEYDELRPRWDWGGNWGVGKYEKGCFLNGWMKE